MVFSKSGKMQTGLFRLKTRNKISLLDSNSKHFAKQVSTLNALNSDPQLHTRQTISHFLCLDVQQLHPLRFNKIQKQSALLSTS